MLFRSNEAGPSVPVLDGVDIFNECTDNQMSLAVSPKISNVSVLFFYEMVIYLLCSVLLHCFLWHYLSSPVGSNLIHTKGT